MKAVVKPVLWIGFKILGGEKIRESMASEMEFVCSVQAACLQLFLFMLHSASFRLTSGIDREAAEGPLQLQAGHEHRYKGDCLEEYHRDNKNISMLIQLPAGAFQEFPKEPAISPTAEWRPGAWLGQDEHFRSNTLWSLLSLGIPQAPWSPKAMTLCCVDCSVLLQWAVARAAAASSCCSLAPLCQLLAVYQFVTTASSAAGVAESTSSSVSPPIHTYSSWPLAVKNLSTAVHLSPQAATVHSVDCSLFILCPEARQFRVDMEPYQLPLYHIYCLSVLSCTALHSKFLIINCKIVWSWWCDWMVVDDYTEMHPFLSCLCQDLTSYQHRWETRSRESAHLLLAAAFKPPL